MIKMEEHMHCCGCHNCWDQMDSKTMMMNLVMKAKMELMKEKIKKKLEIMEGKKLDQMVDLLVEAKLSIQKANMDMMKNKEEMMEKFKDIWGE